MSCAVAGEISRTPQLAQTLSKRAMRVGLLLLAVGILNIVDLAFTLFADRIGMLNEVNPIAASFLQAGLRPSLICYKVLMVLCGLGLIWKLRRSRLAVPACWLLVVAYAGLGVVWYLWVKDITVGMEEQFYRMTPP